MDASFNISLRCKSVSFGEVCTREFMIKKNVKRKTYGPGEHITFRQASESSEWELKCLPSRNHAWLAVDRAMELRESIEAYMMTERAPQTLAVVAPNEGKVDAEDAAASQEEEDAAPSHVPAGGEERHLEDEGQFQLEDDRQLVNGPAFDDPNPSLQASQTNVRLPLQGVQGDQAMQEEGH
eukprot:TRINITY_DN1914_c0_g4_i1.p2 TRINITY_DN1914_c0_g4~~TRINITY_DN1914_c0_g4_i1.p2  ORF type:complete len:181 (-),score=36.11 TRINITY_DN1914_c0_g4_i1:400-942(-)